VSAFDKKKRKGLGSFFHLGAAVSFLYWRLLGDIGGGVGSGLKPG
jgi:hypothetical protein